MSVPGSYSEKLRQEREARNTDALEAIAKVLGSMELNMPPSSEYGTGDVVNVIRRVHDKLDEIRQGQDRIASAIEDLTDAIKRASRGVRV